MTLLLKNGYAVDPASGFEGVTDILIDGGKIVQTGTIENAADREIDCTGLTLLPGLFDMHVHFRDPGQTHKEDILTGAEAAAAGGVTGVLLMPNTAPAVDNEATVEYILNKGKEAKTTIYTSATITRGMKGEALSDYEALKKAGAIAVTDDGRPVKNARLMAEGMCGALKAGMPVISHCEDLDIINGGIINDGEVSRQLGVKGMNRASENYITAREIQLAAAYNARIHIAHVSTAESVEIIRHAKKMGWNVTCETGAHYFALTEKELLRRDADYRMNPPLRTQRDVDAIIDGIKDGTIDAIITDHAPHAANEKADFLTAPNGVVGLETSLAAALTYLYHAGKVKLSDIVRLMAVNPRRILGIPGGALKIGDRADIAIVNTDEEWTVEPEKLHSKSKNTCFKGLTLKGKVKYTINGGRIVFED